MSNVVTNKQEKERKRLLQEEREKRERRRQKELGPANGVDTPEDGRMKHDRVENLPHRKPVHKGTRSISPAVLENGTNSISATMNGVRSGSPTRFNGQAIGGARDSFLNYFFGKDGAPGGVGVGSGTSSAYNPSLGRHVSQSAEPSFSQSMRRQEDRASHRNPPLAILGKTRMNLQEETVDYDYSSPFVSLLTVGTSHRQLILFRAQAMSQRSLIERPWEDRADPRTDLFLLQHRGANPSPIRSPRPSCTS